MRFLALLAAACAVVAATEVDPCKRQPFRGRCPSKNGESPKRSQFVLRYYMRNGECVSYPYGHCASDETEPQLYRYKEECEDACINPPPANLGSPKDKSEQTYGTIGTLGNEVHKSATTVKVEPETTNQVFTMVPLGTTTKEEIPTTTLPSTTTEAVATTTTEAVITSTTETKTTSFLKEATTETTTSRQTSTTVTLFLSTTENSTEGSTVTATSLPPSTTTESITSTSSRTTTSLPRTIHGREEVSSVQAQAETTQKSSTTTTLTPITSVPRTECERRRINAASSTIRGAFVPSCTSQGAFEKVQCEPDGRQCFCVDVRGIEIPHSRTRNGSKPDCESIQSGPVLKTKDCVGAALRGPCAASMTRWYYNEQEANCMRFVYSGCGGNGNNYESEDACTQRCAPPPMGLPKCEKGEPLKTKLGVAVNCAKSDCPSGYKCSIVQQTSVCCPENSKTIGLQTINPGDVCSLPKERGPCDKYELRFYYNAEVKDCKYFFWGGCEGNGNNFEKVEDCESTCGIMKGKESPLALRSTTPNPRQPHFRTTQGIRITPGVGVRGEEGAASESTFVFHTATSAPPLVTVSLPSRTSVTVEPVTASEFRHTSSHVNADSAEPTTTTTTTSSVHVAPTRAPPISQMALLEGSEENQADGVNRCLHPRDPGNCRGQFIRWYWDSERKICDVFTYTGCQGNGNNYASREECLAICHKEAAPVVAHDFANVCKHDVDAGECNGVFQRFAFDTESAECRPFTYGGCGGNGNNFATLAECRIKCQKVALSPGNLCEHDIEVGECSGVFVRFGYDRAANDCRQFTYGGCGGNGNNFATIAECRNVCVKKVCNPNPQCDLTRCQIVNDHNGCPFCSCPPVNQPSPPGSDGLRCPEIDVDSCKDPCIVINNRKGCKDCICPTVGNSGRIQSSSSEEEQTVEPPAPRTTSRPATHTARVTTGAARPPSSPARVGPPAASAPMSAAPPGSRTTTGIRQEAVLTAQSTQTRQLEIDSKQLLPPSLSAQLQEKCMQPVEPGPCKHFVDRWFFNAEDGTCHPFKYGGCAGNRNHFFTQNECEIHCARFLHRVTVPSAMHVPESEFAEAKPPPPPRTSRGPEADTERRPTPTFQRPLQNSASSAVTAPAKPSNIERDRPFLPVTPQARTPAANLPFEIPAHLRLGTEMVKAKGTKNYYPETYEAWGIDLNRHAELAVEPPKQKPLVRAQPTFTSVGAEPSNITAKGSNKEEKKTRQQPLPSPILERPLQTRIQMKPIGEMPASVLPREEPARQQNKSTTSKSAVRSSDPVPFAQSRSAPGSNLATLIAPTRDVGHQKASTNLSFKELPVKTLKPSKAEPQLRIQVALEERPTSTTPTTATTPTTTGQRRENLSSTMEVPSRVEQKSQARQFSSATYPRSYSTNSINSYNPQKNNNLVGLSPPVDPTYFTYNSQHLGMSPNRQFTVNTVPVDKQFVPENNRWLQQNRLQQVQESRAMAQPMFTSIMQRGEFEGKFSQQQQQSQLGQQHQRGHGQQQQHDRFGQQGQFGQQHREQFVQQSQFRQTFSGTIPSVQHNFEGKQQTQLASDQGKDASARLQGQDSDGNISPSTANPPHLDEQLLDVQELSAQSSLANNPSVQHPHTTPNWQISRSAAAQPTTPVARQISEWQAKHHRTSLQQADLRVVDASLGTRFDTSPQKIVAHNSDKERHEQSAVTTSQSPVRESEQIETQRVSAIPASVQQRQQQIEELREQNFKKNTRQHPTSATPIVLTPIKPRVSPQLNSHHLQPLNHKSSDKRISYGEQQSSLSSQVKFPRRRIENSQMVVSSPRETLLRVEEEIVKTKTEWANSNATTKAVQDATAPSQQINKVEFPYGLDRSKFIYWNGDYYAPTIPGVRIPRPGQEPPAQDWTIVEGPPAEMFRQFQRHSKEFQNVAPFVNAARSAVEGEKKGGHKNSVDIMDKTFYLNQEGSVIKAPRVRIPDKRPRKLQELSEHFSLQNNDFPQFLRAPPPNRTRIERPKHTLNQVNPPLHNLPYDNFPNHMQIVNNTFTDTDTNIRRHEQRPNFTTRLNIRPIGRITGVITEDDNDDSEDPKQEPLRIAGITQTRTKALVSVDNFSGTSQREAPTNSVVPHVAHGKKIASIPAIPVEGMMSTASMEAFDERGTFESRNSAHTNRPPTITGQRVSRTIQRSTSTTEAPITITSTISTVMTTTKATTASATTVTTPTTVKNPTTVTPIAETIPQTNTDVTAAGRKGEAPRSSTTEETASSTTTARVLETSTPLRQVIVKDTPGPLYETSTAVADAEHSTVSTAITDEEVGVMVEEETAESVSDPFTSTTYSSYRLAGSTTISPYSSPSSEPSSTAFTSTENLEDVSVSMSESTLAPSPSMPSITAFSSTDTFAYVDLSTILSASETTTTHTSLSSEPSTTIGVELTTDSTSIITTVPTESSTVPVENITTPETPREEITEKPSTQITGEVTTPATETPTLSTTMVTNATTMKKPTVVVSDLTEVDFSKDEQRTILQSRVELSSIKRESTNLSSALARNELQFAPKPPIFVPSGTENQPLKKIEIHPRIHTTDIPRTTAKTSTTSPNTPAPNTAQHMKNEFISLEDISLTQQAESWEAPGSLEESAYSVGREPVPLSPTGIGRNMAKLDIDGLEEPTTVIPMLTSPRSPSAMQSTSQHTTTARPTQPVTTPKPTQPVVTTQPPTPVTTYATAPPVVTTEATTKRTTQRSTTQPPTATTVSQASTTQKTLPTERTKPYELPKSVEEVTEASAPLVITARGSHPPTTVYHAGAPAPYVPLPSIQTVCTLPPDAGSCSDYVPRWFFNAQSGQCEQFSYGSCGGNENNFEDRASCEQRCMQSQTDILSQVPDRCSHDKDGGFGKGYNVKWYFNMRNLRCEQFVFEGQGGNENKFDTVSDCERICTAQPTQPRRPVVHPSRPTTRPPPLPTAPPQNLHPIETFENQQSIDENEDLDYDSELPLTVPSSPVTSTSVVSPPVNNAIDNRVGVIPQLAPLPPVPEDVRSPGTEPSAPAAQAAKTVANSERLTELPTVNVISTEKRKEIYKAEPLPSKAESSDIETLPIVGASPPMSVNYQTGEVKSKQSGIRTFHESAGRLQIEDSDLTEGGTARRRGSLSCPNGLQEIRYADGRPVMCLPGKNQCPEKSVCFFNGVDFFCCPNEEDPYDKHVFGGYGGEETKHGYKVFGPLNIRRLMDDSTPLRVRRHTVYNRRKRQTSMDNVFSTASASFNIDSVTAPLRFDDEKPRTVSRAQRMHSKPNPPNHGNPICIEPLATGDCDAAHMRYYYDRDTDTCRLFYYTGCKGNNNNFGSIIDCQRLCVLKGQRPRPEKKSSSPKPANLLPGQCPDGKAPLGGSAPVLCGNSTDSIGCPNGYFCLQGPPDVCCPGTDAPKNKVKEDVRFAPEQPGVPREYGRKAHLLTPKYMCPDASDPIMASNGEPTPCGAGFDGMKLCPKGFYCAIDVEKQTRMCCPLYGAAERIPSEQMNTPHFARRPSNPGEVLERGSLPSDQVKFASRTLSSENLERSFEEDAGSERPQRPVVQATTTLAEEDSSEFEENEEEEEEEEGMAHLMLKPADPPPQNDTSNDSAVDIASEHAIEMPTELPSIEETTVVLKETADKSVCQIKPSEGRACREDEKPPRTNLHYFYSPKDRRCKLYFYRGCGGNANRFEKKADCERLCLH